MTLFLLWASAATTYAQPFFAAGQDPKPEGTAWQCVEELSDEFDQESLDAAKWQSKPIGDGRTTDKTESWGRHWDRIFHSNAIHRVNRYNKERVQLQAQIKPPTKNHERFYIYGAWWKSPEEVRFYLDGKYAYSIHPKVAWDVPAYIQMAIETYSWNPIPDDGGLVEAGTWEQRTTQYEWVRTWKLVGEQHEKPLPGGSTD